MCRQSLCRSGVVLEWQRFGAEFRLRMVFPSRAQKHAGEESQAVPGTLPGQGGAEGPEPAGVARSGDRPGGWLPECRRILPRGERASRSGPDPRAYAHRDGAGHPFIPFESFQHPAIVGNRCITLVAPERGGHCAFISRSGGRERFWRNRASWSFVRSTQRSGRAPRHTENLPTCLPNERTPQSEAGKERAIFQPRRPFIVFPLLGV